MNEEHLVRQHTESEAHFLARLERLNPDVTANASRKPLAELRKSLAFGLGEYFPVYRYVDGFLDRSEPTSEWSRRMHYLVAGLYATYRSNASNGKSFGQVVGLLSAKRDSGSIELRFLALLGATKENELAYHLRQLTALLKSEGIALDFAQLLADLKRWRSPRRFVQQRWARGFYRSKATDDDAPEDAENNPEEETEDHA